eukprot:1048850-Amphidinium_carterae.3
MQLDVIMLFIASLEANDGFFGVWVGFLLQLPSRLHLVIISFGTSETQLPVHLEQNVQGLSLAD